MKKLLMIVMALAAGMAAWGDEGAFAHATGASMRVDSRTGTRIAAKGASETITYSPKWVGAASCTVTADGTMLKTASDEGEVVWTPTTTGAHVLTHTAGDVTYTVQFAVLGDDVIQHAGTLTGNETWSSNKIHLVTGAVTVLPGKTLTIEPGTVVKFLSGTSLTANGTCMAKGVIFTHVNDDTVGGDTLMDGDEAKPVVGAYRIDGDISDDGATEYRYPEPQTLTETISSNTRLRGHMVYLAHSSITVDSGVTLTLAPGTILKFASGCSMTVNGTLEAQGTRAEPIVFTSLKDDDWGGDTNGDGENTRPGYGDWNQIRVSGTAKFNYANVFYNSATENYGGIEAYGGMVTFDNSVIAHTKYECVNAHSSGRFSASNSVFWDASLGFGYYGGSRVRAVNCVFAEMTTAIRQSDKQLTNCIFYRCQAFTDQSGDSSSFSHCLFWNPVGEGAQRYAKTGKNGNIWADPGFIDPDNGDFRLTAKSPCIDAGAGMEAPEYDFYGVRRVTVRTDGAPGSVCSNGAYPDIGIHEVAWDADGSPYDLVPDSISIDKKDVCAGDELTVSWTVRNDGTETIVGGWHDEIFLVSMSGQSIRLGESVTERSLDPGKKIDFTAKFTLPPMEEGTWYPKVVVNSRKSDIPEGRNTENNVIVGLSTLSVSIQMFVGDSGGSGTFSSDGTAVAKFVLEPGERGKMAHVEVGQETRIVYGYGFCPQGERSSGVCTVERGAASAFFVPAGVSEMFVELAALGDVTGGYSVWFEDFDVAVADVSPKNVPMAGSVTLTVRGGGFEEETKLAFVSSNGGRLMPLETRWVSQDEMMVTVNCEGRFNPDDLLVPEVNGMVLSEACSIVVSGNEGRAQTWARLEVPEGVRQGRQFLCSIRYGNSGTKDAVIPVFQVSYEGDGAISYVGDLVSHKSVKFFGAGGPACADVLRPGEDGRIDFILRAGSRNVLSLGMKAVEEFDLTECTQASVSNVLSAVRRIGATGMDARGFKRILAFAEMEHDDPQAGCVSGRLVDRFGEPCPWVELQAVSEDSDGEMYYASVDGNGQYVIEGLQPGTYSLRCINAKTETDVAPIVLTGHADVHAVDLVVDSKISFYVMVDNVKEDETVSLVATPVDGGEVISSSEENFRSMFRGLSNGLYVVTAISNDGRTGRSVVSLPERCGTEIHMSLHVPSQLEFSLSGFDLDKPAGVIVFCPNGEVECLLTDSNGVARVDSMLPGRYFACAVATEGTWETLDFSVSPGDEQHLTLKKAAEKAAASGALQSGRVSLMARYGFWEDYMALHEGERAMQEAAVMLKGIPSGDLLLRGSSCCDNDVLAQNRKEKKAAYDAFVRAYRELKFRVDLAEKGVDSDLWKNVIDAAKDYGYFMADVWMFKKGLKEPGLPDWQVEVIDKSKKVVDMGVKMWTEDKSVVSAMMDVGFPTMEEVMSIVPGLTAGFQPVESTEPILTLLEGHANAVSIYGKLVDSARLLQNCPGEIGLNAKGILEIDKRLGNFRHLLDASGEAARFIVTLEKIGTDSTFREWGYLMDNVLLAAEEMRRAQAKLLNLLRNKPSVCQCGSCGTAACEEACNKKIEVDEVEKETPDSYLSHDPNEISGPLGVGDARYVKPGDWMTYTVYFENLSNATASAAEVYVKNPLSKWLDWSTFEMGEVAFNNQSDLGLVGLQSGISEVVMSGESYFVRSQVDLDETTGEVNWYLRAYDKTTPDTWPEDITAGLLPPNDETHRGEGHLTYRIKVREDAPRNAIIENSAEIVFDYNPVIPTNPNWWNTVGSSSAEVGFSTSEITVDEGSVIEFAVSGGNAEKASSVGVYLTYLTAAAADIDLKTATVDGVTPKGGIKFPLTLSWAAGEVTNRVIRIPVKTDKTVEGDERLVFQLAAAQGMVVGDVSLCDVTLNDATEAATLQDGAMSQAVKLSSKPTKDAPAWLAGRGNVSDPDGTLGLYHAESPTLALGVSSELTAAVTRSYDLHFKLRFSGPAEEETPSTLAVYDGKRLLGVIGHGVVSQADWEFSVSNEWDSIDISLGGGNATIRLVLTQGSDPAVHAELSDFWCDQGLGRTLYRVKALNAAPAGGYVTGSGLYVDGSTASLKAKANPGWVFRHWLLMDDDESTSVWSVKETVSLKVTDAIRVTAVFEPVPFVLGLADPADGGKISGSGYCAEGKKVTLKATANKNFAFTGWYTNDVLVSGLPTLVVDRSAKPAAPSKTQDVITNITENVTYYAAFKSDPEVFVYAAATDGKGDALTGTGAGKVVAGTVTGMGKYAADKKVTLKATANKGYVFAGWWPDVQTAGEPLSKAASYVIEKMPTNDVELVAAFVTAEEDKASIEASVDGFALEPWVSKDETRALTTNVWAGVSLEWPVAARALSETTVAVSGLPSGLKFAAKPVTSKVGSGKTAVTVTNVAANTIYGAPSAASKTMKAKDGSVTVVPTAVKVTVTTAGKNKQTYQIDMTVDPLPAWAVGTFAGPSYDGDDTNGVASVTVATSGKITAKQPVAGKAVSFSATCFDRYDAEADAYVATLTAKVGTNVVTNVMAVMAAESGTGFVEADLFDAWQHNWKVEPWKEVGKSFDKREVSYEEEGVRVTLKFSASGTAKVAGEFAKLDDEGNYVYNKYGVLQTVTATGSATLLPTLGEGGETRYIAFVYLAPKDLPAHARCVEVAAEVVE